ncbi:MAG TPA: diacylglycerol kinase family protein, partial [Polyangia bacterium]|nr:diacylglycerol kinase family protein [Polyangia bacterium]
MIAVIVNPRSRANRRNPRIAADFQALVGDRGRVFAPKTIEELNAAVAEWRRTPPTVIAVHGGDGTLHKTVTALGHAFGGDPLPPIAILCGGTMNVVASSLHIRERPSVFLRAIVDADRAGRPLETIRRRCLRIGDELGFLFGSGLPANFLTEYYGPGGYGPGRAAWLLTRAFFSALWHGPF